jgi:hypothetical protein
MTLKNLLGIKDLAGLPLLYAGLPTNLTNFSNEVGGQEKDFAHPT